MINNLFYSVSIGVLLQDTGTSIPMEQTDLRDLGLSSSDIDERLIYLASIDTTGEFILIYGNDPRTSASNAAYTELTTTLNNFVIEDRP